MAVNVSALPAGHSFPKQLLVIAARCNLPLALFAGSGSYGGRALDSDVESHILSRVYDARGSRINSTISRHGAQFALKYLKQFPVSVVRKIDGTDQPGK